MIFKFNDKSFSDYFRIIELEEGLLPNVENITNDEIVSHGSYYSRDKLLPRMFTFTLRLKQGVSKDEVRSFLYTREPKELIVKDNGRYYMAKVVGETPIDYRFVYENFDVSFVCFNPIAYDVVETTEAINVELTNTGTVETYGVLTVPITSNVNSLRVTMVDTKEYIHLRHSFVSGDSVVIDLNKETIMKNGDPIVSDMDLESDFFMIPVGKFKITSSTSTGELTYRRGWL